MTIRQLKKKNTTYEIIIIKIMVIYSRRWNAKSSTGAGKFG